MGKYVIRQVSSGVKFDLRAANGQTILTSEVYSTHAACLRGIQSVRNHGSKAQVEDRTEETWLPRPNPRFEVYRDRSGEFRFRLKARNGKVIGISDGYATRAGCLGGVESVMLNAWTEHVEEQGE